MQEGQRLSLEQIRAFLEGSEELRFEGGDRRERYARVGQTLVQQQYATLARSEKGLVKRYVGKMTGLSRAQVTRLVEQYRENR